LIDLRLGDWRDTMADLEVEALISDPPYSPRVEDGFRSGSDARDQRGMGYAPLDETYCRAFVASWLPRVRSWWVVFGDHVSNHWWLDAMAEADLYTFAPVIWVKRGAGPRMTGDGPASQVEHIAVARTRGAWATSPPWGSLRGYYEGAAVRALNGYEGVTGAKPEDLMRALVRDYSRPGWTIADPHAGSGTTLVAARAEGRSCIGSERDPKTYEIARQRLERPHAREFAW
jgi:site-specific DNA-methyltransferase (adenine-specific)